VPGSDAAIAAGCTCPVLDNAHGRGHGELPDGRTVYVYSMDCPLHIIEVKGP
jgi:hypothetical protein